MISQEEFVELIKTTLNRDIKSNYEQNEAVLAPVNEDQFIVAGPGSGKTTTLVLKILKFYFVDDINIENIMVTTFTKKAARQLKDKTIMWAKQIFKQLDKPFDKSFNNIITGTLDGIAEDYVAFDDMSVIDNFTSSALMMQTLLKDDRINDKKLKQFVKRMNENQAGVSSAQINSIILTLREAMYENMADIDELESRSERESLLYEIIHEYNHQLDEKLIVDYALLETRFYELLNENKIPKLENNLRVLLVDEYQDTNFLQEQIYFKLAEYTKNNNGSITVVGDDDQSLYRFRGSNVHLFTNYEQRISKKLDIHPKIIYLHTNYRSTDTIVDFLNDYINIDPIYRQTSSLNKPDIISQSTNTNTYPVVGLFRNNIEELTYDLSNLIYELKKGEKVEFRNEYGENFKVQFDNPSIAVLLNSPKEINAYNRKRLPYFIRNTLTTRDENMVIFNPRGQNIEATDIVSLICGLILQAVDSDMKLEDSLRNIPPRTHDILDHWREFTKEYMDDEKLIVDKNNINIQEVLSEIENVCMTLIDQTAENKIYYDLITETIIQTSRAIAYDDTLTANQVFWHILIPIALGAVELDDDLFDIDLDENINIMSIHQAKGLEFDVVIVDVGSDILNNKKSSAFKRFPEKGGKTYNIEHYVQRCSDVGIINDENPTDAAFDELIRRYFVAYSRSKTLLILCGLNSMRHGYQGNFQDSIKIPNIATGWNRNKIWVWENLDNLFNI
ncbi:DEAD/DEAH box helicase [Methanosphaera cuniculi]|uniref:DEAD/DEAH box helicase n=1 Tax=Methanosphaera cuniculi TaxID=1077256 RepID=UPI0026DC562E|nr:DEAD/DEAH box helicase [Methanosphaera cuniculi]